MHMIYIIYNAPRQDIDKTLPGRLQVICETEPSQPSIIAQQLQHLQYPVIRKSWVLFPPGQLGVFLNAILCAPCSFINLSVLLCGCHVFLVIPVCYREAVEENLRTSQATAR